MARGIERFVPSKFFHAVVISGVALTVAVGTAQKLTTPMPSDTNAASRATKTPGLSQAAETFASVKTCPPGSERPYPPCYWIR